MVNSPKPAWTCWKTDYRIPEASPISVRRRLLSSLDRNWLPQTWRYGRKEWYYEGVSRDKAGIKASERSHEDKQRRERGHPVLQIPSPISEGCTSAAHGQLISTIFSDASVSRVVKRHASMWPDWTGVARGTGKWRSGISQSGEQLGRWKVCGRIWGVTGGELRPLVPPQMHIRASFYLLSAVYF